MELGEYIARGVAKKHNGRVRRTTSDGRKVFFTKTPELDLVVSSEGRGFDIILKPRGGLRKLIGDRPSFWDYFSMFILRQRNQVREYLGELEVGKEGDYCHFRAEMIGGRREEVLYQVYNLVISPIFTYFNLK